jgi:hypothetical protein
VVFDGGCTYLGHGDLYPLHPYHRPSDIAHIIYPKREIWTLREANKLMKIKCKDMKKNEKPAGLPLSSSWRWR